MHDELANCRTVEISAYIDGELDRDQELELELHLAECADCRLDLSMQRQFLCDLDASLLNDGEIAIPADFTRVVVATAESSVGGIRRSRERLDFVFICVAILLFVLFAAGAEAGDVFGAASSGISQMFAIASIAGHLIYSIVLGLVIVLRSVGSAAAEGTFPLLAGGLAAAAVVLVLSRKVLSFRRA